MELKRDIFDRIMDWKMLSFAKPLYKKHKKILLYIFFGGLTTAVSIGSFAIFYHVGINEHAANVISWVLAVLFAFWTNKTWVFSECQESPGEEKGSFLKQVFAFFGGRLFTLGIEEIILLVFISLLNFAALPVKIAAQLLVLVLNYILSKFVFSKK